MTPRTYLEPETNYSKTEIPPAVNERIADFESAHANAEILTVYHVECNRWSLTYATDRGTKRHAEYNYPFTVTA